MLCVLLSIPTRVLDGKGEFSSVVDCWGFIRLEVGSKGLEDIAYDYYIVELLEHSFFHDVVRDDFGEVVMCRMHDFMHDPVWLVAEFEYSI